MWACHVCTAGLTWRDQRPRRGWILLPRIHSSGPAGAPHTAPYTSAPQTAVEPLQPLPTGNHTAFCGVTCAFSMPWVTGSLNSFPFYRRLQPRLRYAQLLNHLSTEVQLISGWLKFQPRSSHQLPWDGIIKLIPFTFCLLHVHTLLHTTGFSFWANGIGVRSKERKERI